MTYVPEASSSNPQETRRFPLLSAHTVTFTPDIPSAIPQYSHSGLATYQIIMPPHSATVRGTLNNPKTQEAKQKHQEGKGNQTQLGDPASLKVEASDSNPVPGRTNQDGAHGVTNSGSPHSSDPYERSPEDRVNPGQSSDSQRPHSQKVRGTMSHPDAAYLMQTNKPASMLGDHVSLKAETSNSSPTDQDRGAGLAKDADEMQNVANERAKAQSKSSKL